MPAARTRLTVALLLAAVLAGALYLVSTAGLQALEGTGPTDPPRTSGSVPAFVYDAPETVRTTEDYGPVGPVAVVYAGGEVREGLLGRMENPWVAVSATNGDYRALSAPHRPAARPGAVRVSPDGLTLAWSFADGVVLYDPLTDTAREVTEGLGADPLVGDLSPDGSLLLVHDSALRIVEVESGRVVGTAAGVSRGTARRTTWTRDGESLTYVDDGTLVTHRWADDTRTRVPTSLRPDATLAWSPAGDRLAAMEEERGVREVAVYDVGRHGALRHTSTIDPDGYAQQDLLGFVTEDSVAVSALTLETATLPLVFEMSTTGDVPPAELMQLQGSEQTVGTMEVATDAVTQGSSPFAEPRWPVSSMAKLVGSVIVAVFLLGLYVTRRPR